jgi:putative phage-type endonuclease
VIEQGTPEWLKARIGRLTGSSWGAALRMSPWQTREDLMRSMVRDALGAEREWSENPATQFGSYSEAGAAFDFTLETGLTIEPQPFIPFETWAGASPDGKASDGGGVEIKIPFGLRKQTVPEFKGISRDEQPHYYAQLMAECLCGNFPHMHFWQYRPGFTDAEGVGHEAVGKHTIVARDDDWLNEYLPALRQFHAEFEDALKEPEEYLVPRRIEIDTPEAARMIREWDEIAETLERFEERKKDLLAEMVMLSEGRNALLAGGRKLSKITRQGSVSYAKIVSTQLPDFDVNPYRGKETEFWKLI